MPSKIFVLYTFIYLFVYYALIQGNQKHMRKARTEKTDIGTKESQGQFLEAELESKVRLWHIS